MRTRALALAAVMAGTTLVVAAPQAQAVDGYSVNITTTRATSYGDRFRSDGHWVWWRPHFTANVTVTCPAGENDTLYFSPVSAMQTQEVYFTCTGAPQTVQILPVGLKGDVTVNVELRTADRVAQATDTQLVRVIAVLQAR